LTPKLLISAMMRRLNQFGIGTVFILFLFFIREIPDILERRPTADVAMARR